MRVLVDTQIVLWVLDSPSRLSKRHMDILLDGANVVQVSQISLFEIAIKSTIGKLPHRALAMVERQWAANGFDVLPLTNAHIDAYSDVPLMPDHRDPFDRLIIATAMSENIGLITTDKSFEAYSPMIKLL